MKVHVTLLVLLIIVALTAAQYSLAAAPTQESMGTSLTGAIPAAATVTPVPTSSAGQSETEPGQVFQVAVATYLLDTAGLHDIDERLNQEGMIDPGDAGVVTRVSGVLAATHWPTDLQVQVDQLQATLSQYAEALSNDDVEAAKPLATEAHELQHDLSHAVEQWLGGMNGSAAAISEQEQRFQATVAMYLLDTAGFHDIDERLNQEGVIDPGDAGVVTRVSRVLAATHWPADMHVQVEHLQATLDKYTEALANDDVEAAKPLATEAHELQHDLSHAVEHWLGGMNGSAEHDAAEAETEHDQDGEHDHSE